MDPDMIAILVLLLGSNSAMWTVIRRYIDKRYGTPPCGGTVCNKTVRTELEKKITRNGRNPV